MHDTQEHRVTLAFVWRLTSGRIHHTGVILNDF